jgi:hypothetical protein
MLVDEVDRLAAAVEACVDTPVWSSSDAEVVSCLSSVFAAHQRLTGLLARLVREVEGRGLHRAAGAPSMAAWVREALRVSPHAARDLISLARVLDGRPGLAAAVDAVAINAEQAAAIDAALADLPAEVGPEIVEKAEAELIVQAALFGPAVLRRLGGRILRHVAPDAADEAERRALERRLARARAKRTLAVTAADGRWRLTGWLDDEAAAVVQAALDPLCRPVPADDRTPGQRRADALTEVCRLALATTDLPANGGDRPQLIVTVAYDPLARQVAAGMADTGQTLTPGQVRRLACDARVLPAVLGGDGEVLELGRSRRLFTGPVRRALTLRDGGCAFPGCDRPPRWCDAHHLRSWLAGGSTDVDNGVLLCGYHHRLIHRQTADPANRWTVRLGPDRRPEFLPPTHLDPARRPRRNRYHPRT